MKNKGYGAAGMLIVILICICIFLMYFNVTNKNFDTGKDKTELKKQEQVINKKLQEIDRLQGIKQSLEAEIQKDE